MVLRFWVRAKFHKKQRRANTLLAYETYQIVTFCKLRTIIALSPYLLAESPVISLGPFIARNTALTPLDARAVVLVLDSEQTVVVGTVQSLLPFGHEVATLWCSLVCEQMIPKKQRHDGDLPR